MSLITAPEYAQNSTELGQNQDAPPTGLVVIPGPSPQPRRWEELLPGEGAKAYQAFMDYAEAGPSRSLRKLLKNYQQTPRTGATPQPPARSLATLSDWSSRFEWRRRSSDYDYEQQAMRRVQMRELRLQRQELLAEEDWQMSQKLRRISSEVLAEASKFFNTTTSRSPATRDRQGNIIGPERVTQTIAMRTRDVLTAAKLASELGRLATGMPTSNLRNDIDFLNMSDAQLLEFLSRHLGSESGFNSEESTGTEFTEVF